MNAKPPSSPGVSHPSTGTYPLFEHMSREHGLTLIETELDEIRHAVVKCGGVVLLEDAEALATALEGALTMWQMPAKDWTDALADYRAKHPKPSTKPASDVLG